MSAQTSAAGVLAAALCLFLACSPGGGSGTPAPGSSNAPAISLLDPLHGAVGQPVSISGARFGSTPAANAVFFGANQASVQSASPTLIVTAVPAGAPLGACDVTVSTTGGTSAPRSFTVDPSGASSATPAITGLSPDIGPVGTPVAISGSAFDPTAAANTVRFNGTQATVSQATATRLDVVVPGGATSGTVVVSNSGGTSNGVPFAVTTPTPADQGASGELARDYLTAVPYTSLLVEVDYIQGQAPDPAALNFLRTRLLERCNKPGGITIQVDDAIPAQGITTWRLQQDVRPLEAQWRDAYPGGNQGVLYFLYLNGGSEFDSGTSRVLGISYTGSSICIFKDGLRGAAILLPSTAIEQAVLVHEAGHNLGLVNNGAPLRSNHWDSAHGAHDSSSSCVMFWQVETDLIGQLVGVPDNFDAACMADLQAIGGK